MSSHRVPSIHWARAAAACCVSPVLAYPLSAATQALEEVIVTAQKRPESAQDVPIAITAFSGEQLRLSGAGNLEGLSDNIPNVDIADSPGTTRVVIRGLGSGTGNPDGRPGSLVQDLDGVQLDNAPELSAALFVDYTRPIAQALLFGTRLDATYKDETSLDFSQDENLFANDFWRFNLRFSLGSMPLGWNMALTVFNMTDEQPPSFGGQEALLPGVYWQNRARGREVELSATSRFTR